MTAHASFVARALVLSAWVLLSACRGILGIDPLPGISPPDAALGDSDGASAARDGSANVDARAFGPEGGDGDACANGECQMPPACLSDQNCCGTAWATGKAACTALGSRGAGATTLYAATGSGSFGIYAITLDSSSSSQLLFSASTGVQGLALLSASPAAFVYSAYDGAISQASGGGSSTLPDIPQGDYSGETAGVAYGPNTLFVGTTTGALALPYPPAASWGAETWGFGTVGPSFVLQQIMVTGASSDTLVGAGGGVGAVVIASKTGDVCFTQACTPTNGADPTPPPASLTGVAVDSSGNLYLVGNDGIWDGMQGPEAGSGIVESVDPSGKCLYLEMASAAACSVSPWGCQAGCSIDEKLTNTPLAQAAFVSGQLYVTGAGAQGGGGPIYSYSPKTSLSVLLDDRFYFALATGP